MVELHTTQNTIYLSGELKMDAIKSAWEKIRKIIAEIDHSQIFIDLSDITTIDSSGVAFLDEVKASSTKRIQFKNIPETIEQTINSFSTDKIPPRPAEKRVIFLEFLGDSTYKLFQKFVDLLYLTSDIFYWSIIGLVRRKGQREGSFIQQCVLIGVDALKIVGLISFLIGFILALQSAAQLRQFGANIYIADLIGIAMLREMGPIMTAIVVAGRSGSAIASEIATMVVTEEIDALKTMAINPVRYVMVPKFHAITFTMPLLTIMADLIGILGGFVIAITYLNLSPSAYFNELMTVLIFKDIYTGLTKSVVFAWIIVVVGCFFGLQVKGGSEGVGKATTASVVASIFLVIVADSILGLIFYFWGSGY